MARLLLVEDNELNRDMLSRRLIRAGHDVRIAVDGAAGLAAARSAPVDLVLLDLALPVMDGWEVARRLKADPRTAAIPVVALTAHAMPDERARALAAGCDAYDTKPVDLPRLLSVITGLLPGGAGA
jgi:CheY-like chemotaxis protein